MSVSTDKSNQREPPWEEVFLKSKFWCLLWTQEASSPCLSPLPLQQMIQKFWWDSITFTNLSIAFLNLYLLEITFRLKLFHTSLYVKSSPLGRETGNCLIYWFQSTQSLQQNLQAVTLELRGRDADKLPDTPVLLVECLMCPQLTSPSLEPRRSWRNGVLRPKAEPWSVNDGWVEGEGSHFWIALSWNKVKTHSSQEEGSELDLVEREGPVPLALAENMLPESAEERGKKSLHSHITTFHFSYWIFMGFLQRLFLNSLFAHRIISRGLAW